MRTLYVQNVEEKEGDVRKVMFCDRKLIERAKAF